MKAIILMIAASIMMFAQTTKAQLYVFSSGKIDFYSKGPIEDIDAHNGNPKALLSIADRKIAFMANQTDFKMQNKLMEEHYNEKYVESEKFPMATFQGKVVEDIDLTKEGVYNVTVTGELKLHGVGKERTIPGTITVKKDGVNLKSVFKVACAEHNITIPSVVGAKISEIIEVTVDVNLIPKK